MSATKLQSVQFVVRVLTQLGIFEVTLNSATLYAHTQRQTHTSILIWFSHKRFQGRHTVFSTGWNALNNVQPTESKHSQYYLQIQSQNTCSCVRPFKANFLTGQILKS